MTQTSYEQLFYERIEAIHSGTDLSGLNLLPENVSHDILQEIFFS